MAAVVRVEIDGATPRAGQLRALALAGYGHFTAMQVRGRRVRGLALHLRRLDEANRELFGAALDGERVREHIRHALAGEAPDASVRVHVQRPDEARPPWVAVIVRTPVPPPDRAWRLQAVPYQRSLAHIKHLGDFGQAYYGRMAARNGFDEALLTAADGTVSEGAMTNVGFLDGDTVVWPDAPLLHGITMQLLEMGCPFRRAPVRLGDVGAYDGVFVANSWGIAPVRQIDDRILPVDARRVARLVAVYDGAEWDRI